MDKHIAIWCIFVEKNDTCIIVLLHLKHYYGVYYYYYYM